jgi:hypothetical protein
MRQYQFAAIALSISLGTGGISTLPASAVSLNWSITFLDGTGNQVGSGSFSYDPNTLDAVALYPYANDYKNVTPTTTPEGYPGFLVPGIDQPFDLIAHELTNTLLEDLQVSIQGTNWGVGASWLTPEGVTIGRFISRYGFSFSDNWSSGYSFLNNYFSMRGKKVGDLLDGSWDILSSTSSSRGLWIATLQTPQPVPEPGVMVGMGVFSLSFWLRKKLAKP